MPRSPYISDPWLVPSTDSPSLCKDSMRTQGSDTAPSPPNFPSAPSGWYLGVVATHLSRDTRGSRQVVEFLLCIPVLHSKFQIQCWSHREEVFPPSAPLLVVVPDALLCIGLGKGLQLRVPALQGTQYQFMERDTVFYDTHKRDSRTAWSQFSHSEVIFKSLLNTWLPRVPFEESSGEWSSSVHPSTDQTCQTGVGQCSSTSLSLAWNT